MAIAISAIVERDYLPTRLGAEFSDVTVAARVARSTSVGGKTAAEGKLRTINKHDSVFPRGGIQIVNMDKLDAS